MVEGGGWKVAFAAVRRRPAWDPPAAEWRGRGSVFGLKQVGWTELPLASMGRPGMLAGSRCSKVRGVGQR